MTVTISTGIGEGQTQSGASDRTSEEGGDTIN